MDEIKREAEMQRGCLLRILMLDADFFFYYINYTLWNMYNVKIYTDTTNKFDNISIRHKDRIITNSNRYFFF